MSCFGVYDLRVEVVLVDMHAVLLFALEGDARAGGLSETVNVVSLDAKGLFDVAPHLFGPGLCAEDACLKAVIFRLVALLLEGFAYISRV